MILLDKCQMKSFENINIFNLSKSFMSEKCLFWKKVLIEKYFSEQTIFFLILEKTFF